VQHKFPVTEQNKNGAVVTAERVRHRIQIFRLNSTQKHKMVTGHWSTSYNRL